MVVRVLCAAGPNGRGVSCSACALVLLWRVLRAVGPEGLLWSACSVGVRLVGWRIFCAQVGPISGYSWGRWYACLSLGACPVGAWEQWRGAYSVRGFGFSCLL